MSETSLGRGLGALIPTGSRNMLEISVESVVANPQQPRRSFDEDALATLAASIREVGVLQPIVVREVGDQRYELVIGERRWRAARRAGLAMVPAIVVDSDPTGSLQKALIENLHRRDLSALEEAAALRQLVDEGGVTHEQLGERVGLSRQSVTNMLRLLELPAAVQRMLAEGKLTAGHARALGGLGGHPLTERIAQRVFAEGLSVRQTEDLVRDFKEESPAGDVGTPGFRRAHLPDPASESVARSLADVLGTKVTVKPGKRKGKLIVEYSDTDDLLRIHRQITGEDLS